MLNGTVDLFICQDPTAQCPRGLTGTTVGVDFLREG